MQSNKILNYALYVLSGFALLYWAWLMLLLLLSFAPWSKPFVWLLMLMFPLLLVVALVRRSAAMLVIGLAEFALAVAVFQGLN